MPTFLETIGSKRKLLSGLGVLALAAGIFAVSQGNLSLAGRYTNPDVDSSRVQEELLDPVIFPSTASTSQKVTMWGRVLEPSNPGVYLVQNDDRDWVTASYRGQNNLKISSTVDKGEGPYPNKDKATGKNPIVFNKINYMDPVYAPKQMFKLSSGKPVPVSSISDRYLASIKDVADRDEGYKIISHTYVNPEFQFNVEVGGGDPAEGGYQIIPGSHIYELVSDGKGSMIAKWYIGYQMNFLLDWRGEYVTTKSITMQANQTMQIGQSQNITSSVSTREPGQTAMGPAVDITTRPDTKFTVISGQDVLSISNNSVTALRNGTAIVQVDWTPQNSAELQDLTGNPIKDKNGAEIKWHLRTTRTIVVGAGGPGPTPTPDPGSGSGECTVPVKTGELNSPAGSMSSGVTGVLLADSRGQSRFDVSVGIPTSESLYANVFSKKYLYNYKFEKFEGKCTFNINVSKTWTHNWQTYERTGSTPVITRPDGSTSGGDPIYEWISHGPESQLVSKRYVVERTYSYWTIESFNTLKISKAELMNYALAGSKITLSPNSYQLPSIAASQYESHMESPEPRLEIILESEAVPGEGRSGKQNPPDQDWKPEAEKEVKKIRVRNDLVTYDGSKIMDDVWVDEVTSAPGNLPGPSVTEDYVLYEPGLLIPSDKQNNQNNPTTGNITYDNWVSLTTAPSVTEPILGVNSVSIHTPVVNYSTMSEENVPFDQSVEQDRSRITLILGRNESITFPESGQHQNYLGYGNKSYSKYLKEKRIQFPFDVYFNNVFYSRNSWIPISIGTQTFSVKIPEWVVEGSYKVRTEAWAENAQGYTAAQHNANTSYTNYGAFEEFVVRVVGRIHGFRVYDIGDLRYQYVFRERFKPTQWTGFQYYSGTSDLNGVPLGENVTADKALPIRPGSHPTQAATTPHNGYPILFYFNTIGNVWNVGEGVKITPKFYFVPKKGGVNPVEVDLYYNGVSNKLIRVGSELDKSLFKRTVMLGDPLRSVNSEYLTYMGKFEYENFWTDASRAAKPLEKFLLQLPTRKTDIGLGYKDLTLNYQMRTLTGPVDTSISTNPNEQRRSVQRWFGEYNLPIAPFIVEKGTNLEQEIRTKYKGSVDGKEPLFLKNGYIIVNFDISTFSGNQTQTPLLKYNASANGGANMWKIEREIQSSTTYLGAKFDFNYGDIVMFESDFSVRDDYKGTGF
jgi:hypothetical protein